MNDRKYVNQYQPQTLVSATILLYINAAIGILSLNGIRVALGAFFAIGAYGIANERKWGYASAVGAAVLWVLVLISFFGGDVFTFPIVLTMLFAIALVALLLHPESREYHRIWFK